MYWIATILNVISYYYKYHLVWIVDFPMVVQPASPKL